MSIQMTDSVVYRIGRWVALMLVMTVMTAVPMECYGAAIDLTGLQDTQTLWLVNRNAVIEKDYYPQDMRAVKGESYLLRSRAAGGCETMRRAMWSDNVPRVHLKSTYRSYEIQKYLFNSRVAANKKKGKGAQAAYASVARFTAIPGTSEHQTGLAMDLTADGTLNQAFARTAQGKWLAENSWKYGFILRYTADKEKYTFIGNEPWHFRYVGMPHSQIMYEKKWCYEQYIYHLKTTGKLEVANSGDNIFEVYYFPATEGLPKQITNSGIQAPAASVYWSSDNAGGYIVTAYGKREMAEQ